MRTMSLEVTKMVQDEQDDDNKADQREHATHPFPIPKCILMPPVACYACHDQPVPFPSARPRLDLWVAGSQACPAKRMRPGIAALVSDGGTWQMRGGCGCIGNSKPVDGPHFTAATLPRTPALRKSGRDQCLVLPCMLSAADLSPLSRPKCDSGAADNSRIRRPGWSSYPPSIPQSCNRSPFQAVAYPTSFLQ